MHQYKKICLKFLKRLSFPFSPHSAVIDLRFIQVEILNNSLDLRNAKVLRLIKEKKKRLTMTHNHSNGTERRKQTAL